MHVENKPCDLRFLWQGAKQGRKLAGGSGRWFAAPYQPQGNAKMKLKDAKCVGWEQQAYADVSYYEIPYEGELDDNSVSRLNQFLAANNSTNGYAGFGSSWNLQGVNRERKVVMVYQRSSIAD